MSCFIRSAELSRRWVTAAAPDPDVAASGSAAEETVKARTRSKMSVRTARASVTVNGGPSTSTGTSAIKKAASESRAAFLERTDAMGTIPRGNMLSLG